MEKKYTSPETGAEIPEGYLEVSDEVYRYFCGANIAHNFVPEKIGGKMYMRMTQGKLLDELKTLDSWGFLPIDFDFGPYEDVSGLEEPPESNLQTPAYNSPCGGYFETRSLEEIDQKLSEIEWQYAELSAEILKWAKEKFASELLPEVGDREVESSFYRTGSTPFVLRIDGISVMTNLSNPPSSNDIDYDNYRQCKIFGRVVTEADYKRFYEYLKEVLPRPSDYQVEDLVARGNNGDSDAQLRCLNSGVLATFYFSEDKSKELIKLSRQRGELREALFNALYGPIVFQSEHIDHAVQEFRFVVEGERYN